MSTRSAPKCTAAETGGSALASYLLFYVFVVLFLISLVMHLVRGGRP